MRIPDVPGCHGGGPTPEAAVADAISALREVADRYVARGIALPAPRGMADIIRDKGAEYNPARESLVMIPLILDKGRPVKANISLDAGLLEAIDQEAKRRGLTRSAFLVSAAIDKIENPGAHRYPEQGIVSANPAGLHAPLAGLAEPAASGHKPRGKRSKRRAD